jgi:hypothetical protein
MKLVGLVSTAVLSLTLIAAAPIYAQEQHEEQKAKPEEQKAKPAQEEKKAQPERSAKPEEKPAAKQENHGKAQENNARQEPKNVRPAQKNAQPQRAAANHGRIPDDRFKANFGQQHRFRVSQADYRNHRFQYGGYAFGFVDPWPSNWLYTQDVYVVEINGVYYLCNASYPGVNLTLSFSL